MGLVVAKCPSCGANLEFDSNSEFGICEFCGTKVLQEKIVIEHRIDESGKYKNYINIANRAYSSKNYKQANNYYTKALEIDQGDNIIVFHNAVSAWFLSYKAESVREVIESINLVYSSVNEKNKSEISREIENLINEIRITVPAEFVGEDSCKKLVSQISGSAELFFNLFDFVEKNQNINTAFFCSKAIEICNLLYPSYSYVKINDDKKTNLNLNLSLSGVSISSNSSKNELLKYNTPQECLYRVSEIKEFFTSENNKAIIFKLKKDKSQISNAINNIKKLPLQLIILHAVFSLPMLIIGFIIALFVHPIPGVILLVIEIICYFMYLKIDSDKTAQKAYSDLMNLISEYLKNKKQIKH